MQFSLWLEANETSTYSDIDHQKSKEEYEKSNPITGFIRRNISRHAVDHLANRGHYIPRWVVDRVLELEKSDYPEFMRVINQHIEDEGVDKDKITIEDLKDANSAYGDEDRCHGDFVFFVGTDWFIIGCNSPDTMEIYDLAGRNSKLGLMAVGQLERFLERFKKKADGSPKVFKADARDSTSWQLIMQLERLGDIKILDHDEWHWGPERMHEIEFIFVPREKFGEWFNEYNEPRKGMKSRWSTKYKKKINCSHPKGFSQKNYCKRKARGGHYLEQANFAGIEDADVSQLERVYNKSKLAVKIVQEYDKATGNKYLTNITTIAPISQTGIYGLYNSAENKAVLGKQYNKQKYTFSQEELDKMTELPEDILRQHKVPEEVIRSIQPTDTIRVNVLSIYKTFNDLQKSGKISPEEAQIDIIREIASTIVHESQHDAERRKTGKTSEAGPQAAEQKFNAWFKSNLNMLKSKFTDLTKTS